MKKSLLKVFVFSLLSVFILQSSLFAQSVSFTIDETTDNPVILSTTALSSGRTLVLTATTNYSNIVATIYSNTGTVVRTFDITSSISFPNPNKAQTEYHTFCTSGGNIFITYNCSDSYQMINKDAKYLVYSDQGILINSGTINTTNPGSTQNRFVSLAELSNGNVLIVWSRSDNSSYAFRLFSANGVAISPADVVAVGTGSSNFSGSSIYTTLAAASSSGGFLITTYYYNGTYSGIRFNNSGVLQQTVGTNTFLIDGTGNNNYGNYAALALKNGNYLLGWSVANTSYYKIISPSGTDVLPKTTLPVVWMNDFAVDNSAASPGFTISEIVWDDDNDWSNPYNTLKLNHYDLAGSFVSTSTAYSSLINSSARTFSGIPSGVGVVYTYYKSFVPHIDPSDPYNSYFDITSDADVKAIVTGFSSSALPVNLTAFSAAKQSNNTVKLWWTITAQQDHDHFEIERSSDGVSFTSIGKIYAGVNASTELYAFIDVAPVNGFNYYRLVQYDKSGNHKVYEVKVIRMGTDASTVSIAPNPIVNNEFTITLSQILQKPVAYRLLSASGIAVQQGVLTQQQQSISTSGLAKGIYLLQVGSGLPQRIAIQ